MAKPSSATLFAFNVGFGDCFLLRFEWDNFNRHVLIDFGTVKPPGDGGERRHMRRVAAEIERLCGGKLDIVVATHRHKDHISGFATAKKGDGPGDVIRRLKPDLVLQPWTERPDLAADAVLPGGDANGVAAMRGSARMLAGMNAFAASLGKTVAAFGKNRALGFSDGEMRFVDYAGKNNVKNRAAVENLMTMAPPGGNLYLNAEQAVDVSRVLPGVQLEVLGPPTPAQNEKVTGQKEDIPGEYWLRLAAAGAGGLLSVDGAASLFPGKEDALPQSAQWLAKKLRKLQKDMLLAITTKLDRAMNNTSLILLFTVGGKSLLFPGDAQWENWQYAIGKPAIWKKLAKVALYKVGHHGSRNATPKSMWSRLDRKSEQIGDKGRLVSVMSTLHGVYDHSEETEVPRKTLVDELGHLSELHSTEDLSADRLYEIIPIDLN